MTKTAILVARIVWRMESGRGGTVASLVRPGDENFCLASPERARLEECGAAVGTGVGPLLSLGHFVCE